MRFGIASANKLQIIGLVSRYCEQALISLVSSYYLLCSQLSLYLHRK